MSEHGRGRQANRENVPVLNPEPGRCRALLQYREPGEYLRCMKPLGHDGTHHAETDDE